MKISNAGGAIIFGTLMCIPMWGAAQTVTSFTVVNADTGADIATFTSNGTVLVGSTPNINVRANASGVNRVVFTDGKTTRTENAAPYAYKGNSGAQYYRWTPAAGTYVINAQPFANVRGTRSAGAMATLTLTITSGSTPSPTNSWSQVAVERTNFVVNGSWRVRYGRNTSWVERTLSGPASCTNTFFGSDPLPGTLKVCEVFNAPTPTPTPTPTPVQHPPTVSAGPDLTLTQSGSTASLTGSASDVDGTIVSTGWTQVSGPNNASLSTAGSTKLTVSDLIVGTYTFRLTARDNQGNVAFDDARVSVSPQTSGQAQTYSLSYQTAPADNPLKGFMPYQGTYAFPHSLEWFYMPLSDSQTGFNTFDWSKLDKNISAIAARGHQAVFGTFVDYPGSPSGMPKFLSGVPGHTYDGGFSPDYDNPDLQTALLNYIAALGARYDADPRVASVNVGLLGYWGEWHTYPNNWMPTTTFQNQVLDAYQRAFPNKQITVREPKGGVNTDRPLLGFGDGSFAYETLGPTSWHFWPRITGAGLQNIWKTRTITGEVRPEVQSCIWNIPTCSPAGQDLDLSLKTTHASWLLYHGLFTGKFSAAQLQSATLAAQSMGYTFHIPQVTLEPVRTGQALLGNVTVENRGIAPFYYPWTVQMAALDASGNLKTWSMNWDLRTVLPGSPGVWTFNVANPGLPSGNYTLLMGVANPMTGGKALKFANTTQDQQRNGWLTIGSFVVNP